MPKDSPLPTTTAGRDAWAHLATYPDQGLVALDYDGTLAPIVARPEDAVAQPGIVDALVDLADRGVQVAVITGRPVQAALHLGGLDSVPRLVLLGHYGLQRWANGELSSPEPGPGVERAREYLREYVHDHDAGMTVEDKHHSVALHTRNAADPGGAFDRARPMAQALAEQCDLELVPGRYVLELRPAGTDKGGALRAVVEQTGAAALMFAGDDLGDLPAVDAVTALRGSGLHAMVVCSDSAETPAALRSAADLVVDGPPGVLETLRALAAAIVENAAQRG